MNTRSIFSLTTIAFGFVLLSSDAIGQQRTLKEQLIGTWALIANENVAPDGTKRQPLSANPEGRFLSSRPMGDTLRYSRVLAAPNSSPTTA